MESLDEIKNTSRCISDRVLNYLQYAEKKLGVKLPNEIFEFYKDLRVDGYFSSGHPRVRACALLYIGAVIGGLNITQLMICKTINIEIPAFRREYKKLRGVYTLWYKTNI